MPADQGRLIAQLDAGVDVLDAEDFESAMPELDKIDRTTSEAGVAHIVDTCGVDIDG